MSGSYDGMVRIGTKIDDSDINSQIEGLKSRLQSSSAKLRDVMQGPIAAVKDLGRAFQQIGQAINGVESDWAGQEKAIAINKATLKATGAEAWTTADAMQALATKLQKITGYADENILSMQNVLLGFKNIKGDNFDQAATQILNMSKVMDMDLTSAAQAVGKALDDPIAGVDSLTRQGFRFSAAQKEVLKDLVNTGQIAKAQGIILDELATTYGGAAAAANETGSAIKDKLGNAISELKEGIGRFTTDALAPSRKGLIDLVDGLAKTFDVINRNGNAPEILTRLATGLGAATAGVAAFVLVSKSAAIIDALALAIQGLSKALFAGLGPWGIAAGVIAALVVAIMGAKQAEDEHAEALRKKLEKSEEAVTEAKALADEYQALSEKSKLTTDQQDRMNEVARLLHEKYPGLTTDTINLAAANGTLAEETMKAAKAQEAQNLANFKKAKEKQIIGLSAGVNEKTLMMTELKIEMAKESGKPFIPQTEDEKAVVAIRQIRAEVAAAELKFKNDWASGTPPAPAKTPLAGGSGTTPDADALARAKANYKTAESLLEKITTFTTRNALHPYSDEEVSSFWESSLQGFFDIDALDLGPEATALKGKILDALRVAFTPDWNGEVAPGAGRTSPDEKSPSEILDEMVTEYAKKPGARGQSGIVPEGYAAGREDFLAQLVLMMEAELKAKASVFGQSTLTPEGLGDGQSIADQMEAIAAEAEAQSAAAIAALESEFRAKTGSAGQSGLTPEGMAAGREDFAEQLVADIVIPASLEAAQTGAVAYGQAFRDGLENWKKEQGVETALSEVMNAALDALAIEFKNKPGAMGQSGVAPVGNAPRSDFTEQLNDLPTFEDTISNIKVAWKELIEGIKKDAEDWSDVLGTVAVAVEDSVGSAFETLGQSIVTGDADWTGWGNSALRALAGVLRSLGHQLLAQAAYVAILGITHLLVLDFAGAAAAAAGAVVALAAAGAAFVGAGYIEGMVSAEEAAHRFNDALDEQNEALKTNRELWTKSGKASEAYAAVFGKIKSQAASFYESLQSLGKDITDAIIDNLVNGFSQDDFLYAMEEYIRKSVIQAAVYTETFMASVATIGQQIATGIANGFSAGQLESLGTQLAALYASAANAAQIATELVEGAFSYDIGSLSVRGDQYAKIHDSEMILPAGIAQEAREQGISIGPVNGLRDIGMAGRVAGVQTINVNTQGIIQIDGREIGRVAFQYSDDFAKSAYGN